MIFLDWCDPNKFIRKKWKNICSEEGLSYRAAGDSLVEKVNKKGDKSVTRMLSAVYDEYLYGKQYYKQLGKSVHNDHMQVMTATYLAYGTSTILLGLSRTKESSSSFLFQSLQDSW